MTEWIPARPLDVPRLALVRDEASFGVAKHVGRRCRTLRVAKRPVSIMNKARWAERAITRDRGPTERPRCLIERHREFHGLLVAGWVDRDELADLAQPVEAAVELKEAISGGDGLEPHPGPLQCRNDGF